MLSPAPRSKGSSVSASAASAAERAYPGLIAGALTGGIAVDYPYVTYNYHGRLHRVPVTVRPGQMVLMSFQCEPRMSMGVRCFRVEVPVKKQRALSMAVGTQELGRVSHPEQRARG